MRYLGAFALFVVLTGCSDASDGANSTTATDESAAVDSTDATDSSDNTDGSESADGSDSDDGTDGATGDYTNCQFQPPVGATCNPYPGCPENGCASSDICTVYYEGTKKLVGCIEAGAAAPGEACDHSAGPYCSTGVCVDGECRSFCVDNTNCPSNAVCIQMSGPPPRPTVCGAAQTDCNPLEVPSSCAAGTGCYLKSDGSTDCLTIQGNGQQGTACTAPEDCAPGFTCTVAGESGDTVCATLCSTEQDSPASCGATCPADTGTKDLGNGYGACVPAGDVEPPEPPPSCDVLLQNCESEAQGCYPTSEFGDACLVKGNGGNKSDCSQVNDCAPGLTCVASKCRFICDPNDPLNSNCETGINAQCTAPQGAKSGYCDE